MTGAKERSEGMRDKNGRFTTKKGETYSAIVQCINCGYGDVAEHETEIPKGITVEEHLRSYPCPLCGCKTMKEWKYI